MQATAENNSSYQEPGSPQLKNEKKANRCQHWDDADIGIIWQDFKVTVIKTLQHAIMNTFEKNEI